jgi:hypothetical protein
MNEIYGNSREESFAFIIYLTSELPPVRNWWLPARCFQLAGIFRTSLAFAARSSCVIGWLLTHPWDGSRPRTVARGWVTPRWSSQHG